MKKIFIMLITGVALAGCGSMNQGGKTGDLKLTGKLEKPGMTTYQYGTHTLQTTDKIYALKSKIDLNQYTDKQVTIQGSKVAGYPVENGPELIEVTAVKVLN